MEAKEILEKLKEGANFELKYDEDGRLGGYGAINLFDCCKVGGGMTQSWYDNVHYPSRKKILESLPWNVVENPRNPKEGEYPTEAGDYIVMLDCDEHAVWHNIFHDGYFVLYNKTHIKWWMPITDEMKNYITKQNIKQ